MPKSEPDPVSARLDVIIRLLLEQQKKESKQTVGDQIVFLESTGLEGRDVAKILGIDVNQLPSYRRSAKAKRKETEGTLPKDGEIIP
jgi:hypothetical protein